jgi:regulator of protease activity HflC (stomatin/prohibitin superfamily)
MSENLGSLTTILGALIFVGITLIIFLATAIKIVPEHQRISVYRLGRYIGERGPGLVLLIPIIDRSVPVDQQSGTGNMGTSMFLVGSIGEAKTLIEDSGEVVINGITWKATSAHSIMPGSRVRVKGVIVDVENA